MKIHIKNWQNPDRFLCGKPRKPVPVSAEALCIRCEYIRLSYDLKQEQEQEALADAGFLEHDQGPNRRWNEY